MSTLSELPEVGEVADTARKLIDRLIDLTLVHGPAHGREAADVVGLVRYRVTEAVMAAFPRAETPRQREVLLHVLDTAAFPWHFEALSFLERVARDDADEGVRLRAENLRRYFSKAEDPDENPDEEW